VNAPGAINPRGEAAADIWQVCLRTILQKKSASAKTRRRMDKLLALSFAKCEVIEPAAFTLALTTTIIFALITCGNSDNKKKKLAKNQPQGGSIKSATSVPPAATPNEGKPAAGSQVVFLPGEDPDATQTQATVMNTAQCPTSVVGNTTRTTKTVKNESNMNQAATEGGYENFDALGGPQTDGDKVEAK